MESMPSLRKQLEGLTTSVIGLQYVWEYRSPSLSVAPLYHCKVCNVHQYQGHMLAHIAGWKHSIRYIKKEHPDKIPFSEEDVVKDPTLKKTLKEVTAELANTVGRGQLKVILKEPASVPAFKGLLSSQLKKAQKSVAQGGPPPQRGGYRTDGFGGYASLQPPPSYPLDHGHFSGMGHNPERNEYEGYEQGGPSHDYEYRERPMNTLEQPHRRDSGDLSGTLLGYLDTFKIENEADAQLVLKVTQKLTDILMEYRLRGVSKDQLMPSSYISQDQSRPSGFQSPPKMPTYNEQFPGYHGPSRYSGPRPRFFN